MADCQVKNIQINRIQYHLKFESSDRQILEILNNMFTLDLLAYKLIFALGKDDAVWRIREGRRACKWPVAHL